MTEADAIARLEAFQILAEPLNGAGYAIFDQVHRPVSNLGRPDFPDVGTRIWREADEWIWEYHWVVPGPGPRKRYSSLSALVDDMLHEYRACRIEGLAE